MKGTPEQKEGQVTHLLGEFWTAANVLSLVRLLLVAPVAYLILVDGSFGVLLTLLFLIIVSDYFDGRVARWSHTVSEWGKVLDPVADKVAAIAITIALVVRGSLPEWFLGVVAGRDVLIVLGGILLARKRGVVVMSTWTGKFAVTAIAITIIAALLRADPPVMTFCLWVTAILLALSFIAYAVRFVRLMRGEPLRPRVDEVQSLSSAT